MGVRYKVLGQVNPASNTATTLYTVPNLTESVISTLTVCNLGISATYRVAVRPNGATLENKHYIVYNAPIEQYDSTMLTLGLSLNGNDVVTVYASTADVAFNLYGTQISDLEDC